MVKAVSALTAAFRLVQLDSCGGGLLERGGVDDDHAIYVDLGLLERGGDDDHDEEEVLFVVVDCNIFCQCPQQSTPLSAESRPPR